MEFCLTHRYHQDPNIFRLNEMENHSYFIPFATEEQSLQPREASPFFYSLCGEWKFHYEPSLYDMPDFYRNGFDDASFDRVNVPECWQMHGIDYAQYIPSPYPFVFDPPYVPEKNPTAAYVKEFEFTPRSGKRYELHFEGKDSCIYVWLNGEFVGYGEVPHHDSVFDVTDKLKAGKNRLCVALLKWCSGSYLDDQDKIRLSGLFREVYILERAPQGLQDFSLSVDRNGGYAVTTKSGAPVNAKICDGNRVVASGLQGQVADVHLWNAEEPYLYDLILECDGEVIRHRFGFREVSMEKGILRINGVPIKIYGVNRHDANPDTGYVTSYDWMKSELMLMKEHNVNAIRTSHYPNDPRFYQLCDELGFYVMSEADVECHGCIYHRQFDRVTGSPLFAAAIHDRMDRMFRAFKNHSCIVIWSLGNECGWGENLYKEMLWFKQTDTRPLHYCDVWLKNCWTNLPEEEQKEILANMDFVSVTYPQDVQMEYYMDLIGDHHGFIMNEYSHAMGNSCGDLRYYDELMENNPRYIGGFIWEWADHALRLTDEAGRSYFGYGGDFGEHHHMGNVCMDGVVAPDRRPHSALREAKAVFAPVRIEKIENGYQIKNRHFFRNLSYLNIVWEKQEEGQITQTGAFTLDLAPQQSTLIPSPIEETTAKADGVLTFRVKKGEHEVAAFSFALESPARKVPAVGVPTITETATAYIVTADTITYRFRKDMGTLTSMTVNGKEMLDAPLWWNGYRPFTDNECSAIGTRDGKPRSFYYLTKHPWFGNTEYGEMQVRPFTAKQTADGITLSGEFIFAPQGRRNLTRGHIAYHIDKNGYMTVHQKGIVNPDLPAWLPRYGFCLPLKGNNVKVSYFGLGPKECYEDKSVHALLGRHEYLPDDPADAYEKPQECGSRCGVRWIDVENEDMILHIDGKSFAFTVSHFDIHQVGQVPHYKDLIQTDKTFIYCDYRMSGVGSNSCGGEPPREEYRINPGEEFEFCVTIAPQKK